MYLNKTTDGRFGYIDAIKGVCMLLVLVDHAGFYLPPMLDYIEVPSFFLISGFLYKDNSFKNILRNKTLRLIIPYFLFSLLYAVPYVLEMRYSDCNIFNLRTLVWFFLSPANEPLWFLKALFWTFVIYKLMLLAIEKISNEIMRIVVFAVLLALLSYFGKMITTESPIFLSSGILQAVVVVPLFAIGNILARINFFRVYHNWGTKRFIMFPILFLLWFVSARSNIALHAACYNAGIIEFYTTSVVSFILITSALYEFKHEVLLSWFGRNSLYILGLHLAIITTLRLCGVQDNLVLLLLTIILLFPIVYATKRIFPFTHGKSK